MSALSLSVPAVAVSAIYCLWHAYLQARLRRERLLRERVTYLLWTAANLPEPQDQPAAEAPVRCGPSEPTPLPTALAELARRRGM